MADQQDQGGFAEMRQFLVHIGADLIRRVKNPGY